MLKIKSRVGLYFTTVVQGSLKRTSNKKERSDGPVNVLVSLFS